MSRYPVKGSLENLAPWCYLLQAESRLSHRNDTSSGQDSFRGAVRAVAAAMTAGAPFQVAGGAAQAALARPHASSASTRAMLGPYTSSPSFSAPLKVGCVPTSAKSLKQALA